MGRKKDPDATAGEKLLSLYTMLFFCNRAFSLSDLARELRCSKQTVSRLIDQLESSRYGGKPLRLKKGKEVAFRLNRPQKPPLISLDPEGLEQLWLCRDFMLHLLPDSMQKNVDATLRQVSACLPGGDASGEEASRLNEEVSRLDEDGNFFRTVGRSFVKGRIDYTPFQEMFQTILRAIRTEKICRISYQASPQRGARTFEYAPMRLAAYHESIRVSGWFVTPEGKAKYEAPAVLLLHRMKEVSLTRRSTHLPDPEDGNSEAFGLIAEKPFTIVARFTESAAAYVAEREWSEGQTIEQNEDGGVTLTMTARSSTEVVSWILSFGDTAELLSPDWLRDRVTENVRALAATYSKREGPPVS
jgi:predicted DNA-binding transcriptional regulator YafY